MESNIENGLESVYIIYRYTKNVYRIYAREFSKRGNVRARVRKTGPVLAF